MSRGTLPRCKTRFKTRSTYLRTQAIVTVGRVRILVASYGAELHQGVVYPRAYSAFVARVLIAFQIRVAVDAVIGMYDDRVLEKCQGLAGHFVTGNECLKV